MLTKVLDPEQVRQAERSAERKYGPDSLNRQCYLLAAVPQQEGKVAEALKDAGFDVYVPREPKSVRVNHIERRVTMRPMLPGYVFPIFDEHRDRWQIIKRPDQDGKNGIEGVLRLFLWGERPVPVGEAEMQRIRDREIEEQMRGNVKKITAPYVAMPGHFVQIDDGGPWNGFIGEVVDLLARATRLIVELNLFGRKTPVQVPVNQVKAI
jgi:transcription termination/antitermination protein NusG